MKKRVKKSANGRHTKSASKPRSKTTTKAKPTRTRQFGNSTAEPNYREIFFRPERSDYVRGQFKKDPAPKAECVFCRSAAQPLGGESLKVWQGSASMVLLNKFPYNTGHLLILPQRHFGELEEATRAEAAELAYVAQAAVRILKNVYKCQGLNVGMNLGAAGGAGIPGHLHMHIVPRWVGDTNFFPLLAGSKVVIESLEQTMQRLLPLFQEEKII